MAEQSQVTNTEPGTAEFEENQEIQENVELQDGLGLQAVGGSIPLKWMRLRQR